MNKTFNYLIFFLLIMSLVTICVKAHAFSPEPNKASLELHSEKSEWISDKVFGAKIHVREAGTQHAQSVLLIHGLGPNGSKDWDDTIRSLSQHYHVIAPDLPGFGQSESPTGLYSPENYAAAMLDIVKQKSKGKVIVVGHSLGGAISLKFTADYPQQVEKLVLVSTAGMLHKTVYAKQLLRLEGLEKSLPPLPVKIPLFDKINRNINRASEWILEKADELPDLTQLVLQSPLAQKYLFKDKSSLNAALALMEENFSDEVAHIQHPVHLIWADNDNVAPLRIGKALNAQIPYSQLHILPDAGHVPMRVAPQLFQSTLLQTLASAPVAQNSLVFEKSLGDLECTKESNRIYSGRFNTIRIHNCYRIKLLNVTANKIIISGRSRVALEAVNIQSGGLTIDSSAVEGTQVSIDAKLPLLLNKAKLDLAGSFLSGEKELIKIQGRSLVYLSLSRQLKPQQKPLHGLYRGTKTSFF